MMRFERKVSEICLDTGLCGNKLQKTLVLNSNTVGAILTPTWCCLCKTFSKITLTVLKFNTNL